MPFSFTIEDYYKQIKNYYKQMFPLEFDKEDNKYCSGEKEQKSIEDDNKYCSGEKQHESIEDKVSHEVSEIFKIF